MIRSLVSACRCSLLAGPSRTATYPVRLISTDTPSAALKALTEEELKITPRAVDRLQKILDSGERLRVEVDGGGCSGFEYKIKVDKKTNNDDRLLEREGVEVVVDELSLGYLRGATIDFVEDLMKASFRVVSNPVAEKGCSCGSSFALKMD